MGEIAKIDGRKDVSLWTKDDAKQAVVQNKQLKWAIKCAADAKNTEAVDKGVELNCINARDVALYYEQNKNPVGKPNSARSGGITFDELGVSETELRRWIKQLLTDGKPDDAKLQSEIQKKKDRYRKDMYGSKGPKGDVKGAKGTGEIEWYTPAKYIQMAREVMGSIDVDPATSIKANEIVKAEEMFTIDDDGLSKEWHGNVWMNPPYAQPYIAEFCEKLVNEVKTGNTWQAIALTHNYTDTSWFQLMAKNCTAMCFTRGRIAFESPEGEKASPTQGQCFFYFGKNASKFFEVYDGVGFLAGVIDAEDEMEL